MFAWLKKQIGGNPLTSVGGLVAGGAVAVAHGLSCTLPTTPTGWVAVLAPIVLGALASDAKTAVAVQAPKQG